MSNSEPQNDDEPISLDDPDWIDRIVAKAMEKAESSEETLSAAAAAPAAPPEAAPPTPSATRPAPAKERPRVATPSPKPVTRVDPNEPTPQATPRQDRGAKASPPPSQPQRAKDPSPARIQSRTAAGAGKTQPQRTAQRPQEATDSSHGGSRRTKAATSAPATSVFEAETEADIPLPIGVDDTAKSKSKARNRALLEWVAVIVGAIAVAFLVKTFLVQAFYIPSSSMVPTLQVNDRVLVNKLSYDFNDVNRGDLIVFEKPDNLASDTDDLIKRVIGLPGETVELIDGRVFIDGRGLNEPYVGDLASNWLGFDDVARELCGGDEFCSIPEDYVFVMGDNRTGSTDSRRFGPVPEESIVGRAFLRIWPLNDIGWL